MLCQYFCRCGGAFYTRDPYGGAMRGSRLRAAANEYIRMSSSLSISCEYLVAPSRRPRRLPAFLARWRQSIPVL